MQSARRPMAVHVTLVAVATLVYMTVPAARTPVWAVIGLAGVCAVLVGIRLYRPTHRWPWWALAAGLLTFITGDTYYNVMEEYFNASNPFPSPRTPSTSPPTRSSRPACTASSATAGPAPTCPACSTR